MRGRWFGRLTESLSLESYKFVWTGLPSSLALQTQVTSRLFKNCRGDEHEWKKSKTE